MRAELSQKLTRIIQEAQTPMQPLETDLEPCLGPMEHVRGVIFDVYGTLLISGVGDISLAADQDRDAPLKEAVEAVGFSWIQEDLEGLSEKFHETIKKHQVAEQEEREDLEFPEVEIREVWESFLEDRLGNHELEGELSLDRVAEVAVRYELSVNPVALMPGIVELLQALQARQLPMSIISNAQFFTPFMMEALLEKPLEDLGLDPLLHVWSFREREGKPSKALYEKAAELWESHYQALPEQLLYIGNDIRNDIWPASRVGFSTGLFAGDARSLRQRKEDLNCQHVKPDFVFTHLSQVLEVL